MLKIGLTGGIGVGKTVCAHIFEAIGVPIYNSDIEAKRLMTESEEVRNGDIETFGPESYVDGQLNRKHLSTIIFADTNKLRDMNAIVHPAVRKDFLAWCERHVDEPYVIQEAALFFETGSYLLFDKTIVVDAPLQLRIERVMKRDNVLETEVMARINKQFPQEDKVKLADFVILNDGVQSLVRQVVSIHIALLDLQTAVELDS